MGALGKNHQLGLRRCEINTCRDLLKVLWPARAPSASTRRYPQIMSRFVHGFVHETRRDGRDAVHWA